MSSRGNPGTAPRSHTSGDDEGRIPSRTGASGRGGSCIGVEPERIEGPTGVVHDCRQLRPIPQDLRVIWLVEEQPSADEDPVEGGGIPTVQEPLDCSFRREVDGGRLIRILNEAGAGSHPLCERPLPRFIERLLKAVEEGKDPFPARRAIGIAARRGEVEPEADSHATRVERWTAEPADIELRFPASPMMKGGDVPGRARVETVRVEQLRPALSLALTGLHDPGGNGRGVDRVEQRFDSWAEGPGDFVGRERL